MNSQSWSRAWKAANTVSPIHLTAKFDEMSREDIRRSLDRDNRAAGAPAGDRPLANSFGLAWFLPSILRYRKALAQVLVASLFIQLCGLITPLFFQITVDKVLVHRSYSTLVMIVVGLAILGVFHVLLQYLRTYVLSHTTSRIDVELGARLFDHLLRLPLAYFETRPAGQTVARVRELETIRAFLTGQGLSSAIDLLFSIVFLGGPVHLFAISHHHRPRLDPLLCDCRDLSAARIARKNQRSASIAAPPATSSWSRLWSAPTRLRLRRSSRSCEPSGRRG